MLHFLIYHFHVPYVPAKYIYKKCPLILKTLTKRPDQVYVIHSVTAKTTPRQNLSLFYSTTGFHLLGGQFNLYMFYLNGSLNKYIQLVFLNFIIYPCICRVEKLHTLGIDQTTPPHKLKSPTKLRHGNDGLNDLQGVHNCKHAICTNALSVSMNAQRNDHDYQVLV